MAKAKALVAEVGTIPTIPYTYTSPNPLLEATAAIVQANLAEVGIPVELDPVDGAQFVKQLIGAKFKGLWTAFHSWAQYTPSTLTVSAYPFNAHKNASQYESKDYIADADGAWQIAEGTSPDAVAAYAKVSEDLLEALFLAEIAVVLPAVGPVEPAAGRLLHEAVGAPADRRLAQRGELAGGALPVASAAVRGGGAAPGLGVDLRRSCGWCPATRPPPWPGRTRRRRPSRRSGTTSAWTCPWSPST